jgi:hypothetical protein
LKTTFGTLSTAGGEFGASGDIVGSLIHFSHEIKFKSKLNVKTIGIDMMRLRMKVD